MNVAPVTGPGSRAGATPFAFVPVRQTDGVPELLDLNALEPAVLLGVAVLLVLVQTAFVLGFLVPAGKAAVLAGVLAGVGEVDLVLAYSSLAGAAILGAGLNYVLGRRHGTALLEHRMLTRHAERVEQARDLVHRRAGFALLAGRSLAIFRATTPALAGAAGVDVRRFLFFNVVGGLLWAFVFVGSGYAGGRLLPDVEINPTAFMVGGVVLALVVLAVLRLRAVGLARRPVQPGAAAARAD